MPRNLKTIRRSKPRRPTKVNMRRIISWVTTDLNPQDSLNTYHIRLYLGLRKAEGKLGKPGFTKREILARFANEFADTRSLKGSARNAYIKKTVNTLIKMDLI